MNLRHSHWTRFVVSWMLVICAASVAAKERSVTQIFIRLEDPTCASARNEKEIYLIFNNNDKRRVPMIYQNGTWLWNDKIAPLTFDDPKTVNGSVQFSGRRTRCRKPDDYRGTTMTFTFPGCNNKPLSNVTISSSPPIDIHYVRVIPKDPYDDRGIPCGSQATFFSDDSRTLPAYWKGVEKLTLYLFKPMEHPEVPVSQLIDDTKNPILQKKIGPDKIEFIWAAQRSEGSGASPAVSPNAIDADARFLDVVRFTSLTLTLEK